MSATLDTTITLNVNCAIVIPMELTVTYAKWVVDSVLAKRITEGRTAIDAKKNIMDFQIAYVSYQTLAHIKCFGSSKKNKTPDLWVAD